MGPCGGAFTSAICQNRSTGKFICFDSHSRSELGLCTPDGTAVIVEVTTQEGLVMYIKELAQSLFGKIVCNSVPFEISPMSIEHWSKDSKVVHSDIENTPNTTQCETGNVTIADDCSRDKCTKRNDSMTNDVSNTSVENDVALCPTGCTIQQFTNWKLKRPWFQAINLNDKLIGIVCTICKDVGHINKCSTGNEKLKVQSEWKTGITAKSSKKLHDKMCEHEKSIAHAMCGKVLKESSEKQIEQSIEKAGDIWRKQNQLKLEQTNRVFRTVYLVAWKHLSFKVYPHLFELQVQNGSVMGRMLMSDHSCSNIVNFIAEQMRKRLTSYILKQDGPFALMMDESTTMSNETVLILYIRALDNACIYYQ